MKLYGLAIAAVPRKAIDAPDQSKDANANIIDVTCTPIAVTDNKRTEFEIVKENDESGKSLAFKATFDVTKPKEVMDCFIRSTNLLKELVKRQEKSIYAYNKCHKKKIDKLPKVALEIGQDSRRPINKTKLFLTLFGRPLFHVPNRFDLEAQYNDFYNRREKNIAIRINEAASRGEPIGPLEKELEEVKTERKEGEPQLAVHAAKIRAKNPPVDRYAATRKARADFLSQNTDYHETFKAACAKLPKLLNKCTLQWGSYTPFTPRTPEEKRKEKRDEERQKELDERLIGLKKAFFDKNNKIARADARAKLIKLARQEGTRWGSKINENPGIFWHDPPSGYDKDAAMQEAHPGYQFYDWDPAIREAFYSAYRKTTISLPHVRHLKLPTDARKPFFADPCADMICTQFDIIDNYRKAEDALDKPTWRELLAISAENAAQQNSPGF